MGRPRITDDPVVITFKDTKDIARRLEDEAVRVGRTRSGLLRVISREYLERLDT